VTGPQTTFAHPLVGPAELADRLAGPDVARPVVVDVLGGLVRPRGRADHEAAHVPGAVPLDLDADLAGPAGAAGRHPLPDAAALQAALRRAGVRTGSAVVAHDGGDGSIAARLWWLLRWAGVPADRVAVLDGGWAAWTAAGLPTASGAARPGAGGRAGDAAGDVPGDVVVHPGGMPVLDADGAARLAREGVLLDARAAARYRGEVEPVDPRPGHVPGARNLPTAELVGPDGRWRSPAELAALLAGLGVRGGTDVGAYCGSGVTACALVLAAERAGVRPADRPVALYPGSWSHWSRDPARPAAVGAAP
jgi:thiosulfate/3-mercaptopyruvate sulfurtransferase